MTELEALRAVVDAARCIRRPVPGEEGMIVKRSSVAALTKIITALDALPAPQPPGETVPVRRVLLYHKVEPGPNFLWRAVVEPLPGQAGYFVSSLEMWRHFATLTARVAPPVVPVIAATVEPAP